MSTDRDQEDKALDALIAAAYWQDSCEDVSPDQLRRQQSSLTPEDRAALAALGDDLAARIISGTSKPRGECDHPGEVPPGRSELELAGSMHRGDDEGELTDAAREEMEERLRELEKQQEDKGDEQQP